MQYVSKVVLLSCVFLFSVLNIWKIFLMWAVKKIFVS